MSTFDTPTPITLSIDLGAGSVVVEATTTDTTQIHLTPLDPDDRDAIALIERAQVTHEDDTVTVHLPHDRAAGLFRRSPGLALAVRMPVGSTLAAAVRSARLRVTGELENVRVDTASGDVSLADVSGSVDINAASGRVRIGTVGGWLRIKSASGDVHVETCCGDSSIRSASGEITLATAKADVTVKTASGDVAVGVAEASVSASAASGDIELGLVRAGTVKVKSVSGDVAVGVQRGIAVWLDISSLSGRVTSSLDRSDRGIDDAKALELSVTTVSGDIRLASA